MLKAFRKKISLDIIYKLSKVDPWFLNQIKEIVDEEININSKGLPKTFEEFNRIKSIGFSDKKFSQLTGLSEMSSKKKKSTKSYCLFLKKLILVLLNLNLLHLICILRIKEIFQ